MKHDAATVAQFLDGETRFIMAAWRDDGRTGLYTLVDGEANERRAMAKRDLRCFVRDCPNPSITTVARSRGRQGFKHDGSNGDGHAPESMFHIQGKSVIAAWLTRTYPGSTVAFEEGVDSQRSRVADVMITAPNGKRVAVEVQYSPLTPDEWRRRHDDYAAEGVVDIWLFGHTGKQLRTILNRAGETVVKLNPTHEAVVRAGLPLVWFNPMTESLATAVNGGLFAGLGPHHYEGDFRIGALAEASVKLSYGLWTPYLGRVTDATRQHMARREAEIAALAAEATRIADLERRNAQQLERENAEWLSSAVRASVIKDFDGWPVWLAVQPGVVIPVPVERWQLHLYDQFVRGKAEKTPVMLVALMSELGRFMHGRNVPHGHIQRAVQNWLDGMVRNRRLGAARGRRWGASMSYFTLDLEKEAQRDEWRAEVHSMQLRHQLRTQRR